MKRLSLFLLSIVRRQSSDLNGSLEKAVDVVLLVRHLLSNWSELSDSARYQILLIIEDRAGNLASNIKGFRALAEERRNVLNRETDTEINEYLD